MRHFIFQGLAITVGVLSLYLAFFLSTDKEGKSRDRIEDLWSRIEGAWNIGGNRSAIFLRVIAHSSGTILDALLGAKLISYRSFGVSSSFALFGFWMYLSILLENHDYRSMALQVFLAILALFCGAAPLLFKRGSMTGITLCPCLATPAIALGFSRVPLRQSLFIAGGLIAGLLAGYLLIALQRSRMRRMFASRDLIAIVPMIFLQALLPLLLFSVPFIVDLYLGNGSVTIFVEILTYLNFSNELILLTFFVVLALVILHRLLWPVLGRLVYASAKYRIVHRPVIMAGFGIVCLLAAFQHG
jgi:hypothetical protein